MDTTSPWVEVTLKLRETTLENLRCESRLREQTISEIVDEEISAVI